MIGTEDVPVVACQGLSRVFRSGTTTHRAVSEVTLTLRPGQRVALVGRSGSGKSTLIHLLAGLDQPDEGTITWTTGTPPADRFPRGVVFQAPSLIPSLNVIENVELPLLAAGRPAAAARAEAAVALTDLDLADYAERLPDHLSGGQAQRVAVARALAARPRLLLADEPTGQLDRRTAAHVIDVLLTAATLSGSALLVATHDLAVAERLDESWPMIDGRLLAVPKLERTRP